MEYEITRETSHEIGDTYVKVLLRGPEEETFELLGDAETWINGLLEAAERDDNG